MRIPPSQVPRYRNAIEPTNWHFEAAPRLFRVGIHASEDKTKVSIAFRYHVSAINVRELANGAGYACQYDRKGHSYFGPLKHTNLNNSFRRSLSWRSRCDVPHLKRAGRCQSAAALIWVTVLGQMHATISRSCIDGFAKMTRLITAVKLTSLHSTRT